MQAALTHPHMQLVKHGPSITIADLDTPLLTFAEARVALRIYRLCADGSVCDESASDMAEACGANVKTVRAALAGLESKQVIRREEVPGAPPEISFLPPSMWGGSTQKTGNPLTQNLGIPKKRVTPLPKKRVDPPQNDSESKGVTQKTGRVSSESDRVLSIYINTTTAPVENAVSDGEENHIPGNSSGSVDPADEKPPRFAPDSWQALYAETFCKRLEDAGCLTPSVKRASKKDRARKMQAWADVFDKLHRIDGHSTEHIAKVLKWLFQPGNWWIETRNIQSAAKLRDKTDQDVLYFDLFSMKMDVVEKALPPLDLTRPIANRDLPRALREHGLNQGDFWQRGEVRGEPQWMLYAEKRREMGIEQ